MRRPEIRKAQAHVGFPLCIDKTEGFFDALNAAERHAPVAFHIAKKRPFRKPVFLR
jgi:hypothetical protein